MSKVVFITGASSGLGLTTALYLQKKGYKVFGTCRNPIQYEKHYPFTFLTLEISDSKSIQSCIKSVLDQTVGRLDGLDIDASGNLSLTAGPSNQESQNGKLKIDNEGALTLEAGKSTERGKLQFDNEGNYSVRAGPTNGGGHGEMSINKEGHLQLKAGPGASKGKLDLSLIHI